MSNARIKIIEGIAAPLGFFVLALLIVESFLAIVLVGADLQNNDKILAMWLGVGLFIMVTIAVFILVWFKPQNLTFDKNIINCNFQIFIKHRSNFQQDIKFRPSSTIFSSL